MTLKELRAKNRHLKTQARHVQRELQLLLPMLSEFYETLRYKDTGLKHHDFETIYDESALYAIEENNLERRLSEALEALDAVYGAAPPPKKKKVKV